MEGLFCFFIGMVIGIPTFVFFGGWIVGLKRKNSILEDQVDLVKEGLKYARQKAYVDSIPKTDDKFDQRVEASAVLMISQKTIQALGKKVRNQSEYHDSRDVIKEDDILRLTYHEKQ